MLYLIRHGNTTRTKNERVLSPEGNRQARLLAKNIRISEFDLVLCSPKTRAKQTLHVLRHAVKALKVLELEEIREIYQPIIGGPYNKETSVARMRDDKRRIERAWQRLKRIAQDQNVAVICHANVVRYFIARFAGFPEKKMWKIEIAEASVVILNAQSGKVEFYNYAPL